MIYGLRRVAVIEEGAAICAKQVRLAHSTAPSWTKLDRDHRLALVDRALRPAHPIDGYPLAL